MMPKSGHRTSWEEALPLLSPECQPWPQHHCHPLPEWNLCGSPVPGSLCHHLPIPFRHISGYIPHSRCPGGGGRERRYFAFSPSLWSLMHNVESFCRSWANPSFHPGPSPTLCSQRSRCPQPNFMDTRELDMLEAKTEVHICLTSSEERHFP